MDIKVQTSYFYQIRNFTPNMVPLSTAMWDPKFHEAPNNPCSERWMVQKWFSSFGLFITEFNPGGDARWSGEGLQHP